MNKETLKYLIEKTAAPSLNRIRSAVISRTKKLDNMRDLSVELSKAKKSLNPDSIVYKNLDGHYSKNFQNRLDTTHKTIKQVQNIVDKKSRSVEGALELANESASLPRYLRNAVEGQTGLKTRFDTKDVLARRANSGKKV